MPITPEGLAAGVSFAIIFVVAIYRNLRGKITANADSVNATTENLNKRIADLEKDKQEAEKQRDDAKKETGRITSELETKISDLQKQIDALRQQNQQAVADTAKVTLERDNAQKEYVALLEQYNESQRTVISMGNTIHEMEVSIRDMKTTIAANKTVQEIVDGLSKAIVGAIRDGMREVAQHSTDEHKAVVMEGTPQS